MLNNKSITKVLINLKIILRISNIIEQKDNLTIIYKKNNFLIYNVNKKYL